MQDQIQNLIAILSKLEDTAVPDEAMGEIIDILEEATDTIDEFIFNLED